MSLRITWSVADVAMMILSCSESLLCSGPVHQLHNIRLGIRGAEFSAFRLPLLLALSFFDEYGLTQGLNVRLMARMIVGNPVSDLLPNSKYNDQRTGSRRQVVLQ